MSIELDHHLKLALKYFEEGKNIADKDLGQRKTLQSCRGNS
jgi:hypothetical protein